MKSNLKPAGKNQVRVRLVGLGCPLVGDRRYGAVDEVLRRIRLHAFYLDND